MLNVFNHCYLYYFHGVCLKFIFCIYTSLSLYLYFYYSTFRLLLILWPIQSTIFHPYNFKLQTCNTVRHYSRYWSFNARLSTEIDLIKLQEFYCFYTTMNTLIVHCCTEQISHHLQSLCYRFVFRHVMEFFAQVYMLIDWIADIWGHVFSQA